MRKTIAAAVLLLAAAPAGAALKGASLSPQARITLAAARKVALAARSGTIVDQELERERGGSGLRYSFDIKAGGATWEVGVDAETGAILENVREGAHPD